VLYHKNVYFYQVLEPVSPSPEITNSENKP